MNTAPLKDQKTNIFNTLIERQKVAIMLDLLFPHYKNDHFFFQSTDSLNDVCNAPNDASGVYLIFALENSEINLVYIGSSGEILQNGEIKMRNGGLYDRIVNGKQFEKARKFAWPEKMTEEEIEALDVYWFQTFNETIKDIPKYIESMLIQNYFSMHGELPRWHKKY